MNNYILIFNIILFISLFITCYFTLNFLKNRGEVERLKETLYNKIVRGDINKESDMEYLKNVVGEIQKKTIYERINNLLYYSGVRFRLYWLTPTVFLGIIIGLSILAMVLSFKITANIFLILAITATPLFIIYLVLFVMMAINNKSVENELIQFMNMIVNFSASSDDIVFILEKSSNYLGTNLRLAITSCISYAKLSGNTSRALMRLADQVEHPQFKRFVLALELASRNSCDYKRVVDDFRERTNDNLSAIRKLDAVYKNCKIEVFLMLFVGAFVIYMSLGLVSEMGGFMQVMTMNIFGEIILAFLVLVYLISGWYTIFKLNNKYK